MPFASFRANIGFAKDGGETYTAAAVAVGATTIPQVSTTSGYVVPATATIYLIDGPNSEVRAVTAGGGSASLTVAPTTFAHPVNTPIAWQATAGVGPVDFMPVTGIDIADTIANLPDMGIRGSNVSTYNVAQGVMHATLSINGDVFPDTFGYILGSTFGAADFSAGSPNTHTIAAMNTPASNGQPTGMLLFVYNGNNTRLMPGAKCSQVNLKFDPAGLLSYTSTWMGYSTGVVANYTPAFSALPPQGGWQAACSIAGVTLPNVLSADFTFKRTTMEAIQTLDGSQQAYKIWAGPLEATGTINAVMEDDSLLNLYLANSQPPVVFTLTNGTGPTQVQVQVQMTKCQFTDGWKPKITGGKGYVEIGGPVSAVANVTDANVSGGGYSPARVVLKNTKATGTYQ